MNKPIENIKNRPTEYNARDKISLDDKYQVEIFKDVEINEAKEQTSLFNTNEQIEIKNTDTLFTSTFEVPINKSTEVNSSSQLLLVIILILLILIMYKIVNYKRGTDA